LFVQLYAYNFPIIAEWTLITFDTGNILQKFVDPFHLSQNETKIMYTLCGSLHTSLMYLAEYFWGEKCFQI
jgi:hypothetical protein